MSLSICTESHSLQIQEFQFQFYTKTPKIKPHNFHCRHLSNKAPLFPFPILFSSIIFCSASSIFFSSPNSPDIIMIQGRRHRGEIRYQEVQGTRSHHRKPPFHGNWQANVPSWEKRFCYLVGKVPWSKVMETKKLMYLYDNVVQWNDSACEEAFHNAKGRFWANMNGLPCDTPLPDPDIYIDEIDWDSDVNPELYLDLEREPESPDDKDNHEEVVILDNSLLMSHSFSCHGWGDPKDDIQNLPTPSSGPKNRDMDSWEGNVKKKESSDWNMSRYKTSRYNGEHYQMDRGWWRGGRGRKRVNFVY